MAFKECTQEEIKEAYAKMAESNRHLSSKNLLIRATAEKLGARPSDVRDVLEGEDE